jgi:hypothetical protein
MELAPYTYAKSDPNFNKKNIQASLTALMQRVISLQRAY